MDDLTLPLPGTVIEQRWRARLAGNAIEDLAPVVWVDGAAELGVLSAEGKAQLLPGWVVGPDGWLYYQEPVAVDGATTPAFEAVHMAAEMGNVYQESTCDLLVEAQAVQSDNNPLTGELWEIPGWPEEGA